MDKPGHAGAKRARRHPPATERPDGEPMPSSAEKRVRVLVLEDDADTREVLGLFLCEDEGFEMEACGDVAVCLDLLRAAARAGVATFDVLLLDLLLLDGHVGTEVIEAARDDPRVTLPPVVVCTAVAPAWLLNYLPLLDACGAHIVSKPFNMDALQSELRAAAAHGSMSNPTTIARP
jgi:CheY-like chemotaxis protein